MWGMHMSTIENALLGAMMLSPAALSTGISSLDVEDFTEERKIVFKAIKSTQLADHGASVIEFLETEGLLNKIGGIPKIESLKDSCVSPDFAPNWVRTIKRATLLRKIGNAGKELIKLSEDGYTDDLVRKASLLVSSSFSNKEAGISTLEEAAKDEYERLVGKSEIKKFDSRLASVRAVGAFYPHSDISAIAGKTGIGKTFFALKEAVHQIKQDDENVVLFVPLEMSKDALIRRVITQELAIPPDKIFKCEVDAYQLEQVKTFSEIDMLNRFFIARDINTPSAIELMANFVLQRTGKSNLFIVVDPAILASPDKVTNNATQDARSFWDGMKQATTRLAEQYNLVSTLIAHHLTKASSKQDHTEFTVEDLDTAGHHNISLGLIVERNSNGVVNLHCVKNRHGRHPWTIPMVWREANLSFDDMVKLCPHCAADSVASELLYDGTKWRCKNGHSS